MNPESYLWTLIPDIFFYPVNVTRSSPVLYREYRIQDGELFPRLSPLSIQIKGSILLFAFFFDFRADSAIILEIKSRIDTRQSKIQISRALRRILMLLIFPEESWGNRETVSFVFPRVLNIRTLGKNKTNWFPVGPDINCFVIFLGFHFNSNKRITGANQNSRLGTYNNSNLISKTTEWMQFGLTLVLRKRQGATHKQVTRAPFS